MPEFRFPRNGWKFAGSNSYGAAELYHEIPKVVVKIFPETERVLAGRTIEFLRGQGLATATMEDVRHVDDGLLHCYVFAERREFLALRDRLFPDLAISE